VTVVDGARDGVRGKELQAMETVEAQWRDGKRFDLTLSTGDGLALEGWQPATDLVLAGLAACSGRTFLAILGRMRLAVAHLELLIDAEQSVDPPELFTRVTIHWRIWLGHAPEERVRHALSLVPEYCTVTQILRRSAEVVMEAEVHPGSWPEQADVPGVGSDGTAGP
jgi:uncharacterized OsmC-like protein